MRSHGRWWVRAAAAGFVFSVWVALAAGQGRGGGQGPDPWADNLPPGQGKELVVEQCGNCHTLEPTVQLRQTLEGWEGTVYDMIGRGAPIFLDEAKEIIAYFSDVFGVDSPPFIDVNRASKDELVKVPGITAELADQGSKRAPGSPTGKQTGPWPHGTSFARYWGWSRKLLRASAITCTRHRPRPVRVRPQQGASQLRDRAVTEKGDTFPRSPIKGLWSECLS